MSEGGGGLGSGLTEPEAVAEAEVKNLGVDFINRLIGGVGVSLDQLSPEVCSVLEENRRHQQAGLMAVVSHGVLTLEDFEVRFPGVDRRQLLADPEFAALIEEIGSGHDFEEDIRRLEVDSALEEGVAVLRKRMAHPDCTTREARDALDVLMRVQEAGAKRERSGRERVLTLTYDGAIVTTPEYPRGIGLNIDGREGVLKALRALRCTEFCEVEEVLSLVNASRNSGSLVLGEW